MKFDEPKEPSEENPVEEIVINDKPSEESEVPSVVDNFLAGFRNRL